jgi:hypothetical protein
MRPPTSARKTQNWRRINLAVSSPKQVRGAASWTAVAASFPLAAAERLEAEPEVALKQRRLRVERAITNYEAQRAERRYRAAMSRGHEA